MTNPITDLVPLCANCHRIAHKRTPPYRPDEIRLMIEVARAETK
jgi:5-methylcytosine-specific restriction protein A